MVWKPRLWYSRKIAPGVRLNIGKTGLSLTFGPKGLKVTIGHGRIRKTVGIPGTGLWFSEVTPIGEVPKTRRPRSSAPSPGYRSQKRSKPAPIVVPEPTVRPHDGDGDGVLEADDFPGREAGTGWTLPPRELLDAPTMAPTSSVEEQAVHERNQSIIVTTLAGFDIPARVRRRHPGPGVTKYEVEPAAHIKISRIEALADDLAMALEVRSIRIEAPIPGTSSVGIEIPNAESAVVSLQRILDEVGFAAGGSKVTFALGRDFGGSPVAVDLATLPHLFIAGAPGSGKSVMLNALITSILCTTTPDEVRMVLVDCRRVEFAAYSGLPHLLLPVIHESARAKAALKWAEGEVDRRYRRFAGAAARNIKAFNESRVDPADRMPYIVIVIDELADLLIPGGSHIEEAIVRLALMSGATGIHMVLATHLTSPGVITNIIKEHISGRIAFAVRSQADSRSILDAPGAEALVGLGDMLYQQPAPRTLRRLQGILASDREINRVCAHWRDQLAGPVSYEDLPNDSPDPVSLAGFGDDTADPLLPDAVTVIREYDRVSASLLQRRLKIGYARASGLIGQLEARGYVGAFDGSNARLVLHADDGSAADRRTS